MTPGQTPWLAVFMDNLPMATGYSMLDIALLGYLARYSGATRQMYGTDLKRFFAWCLERGLEPLEAKRPHIELYVRWCEEDRRYAPATTARQLSTIAGFYRLAVIDGYLIVSPAEYVRRPKVSDESSRLGLSHLEFEAVLAEAHKQPKDEVLICLLGLLGLRVTEACSVNVEDFGFQHGHRTIQSWAKARKSPLSHYHLEFHAQ